MRKLIILHFILFTLFVQGQEINIIPQPVSLEPQKGSFTLTKTTAIILQDEGDRNSANFLNSYLKKFYGFQLTVKNKPARNAIRIYTKKFIKAPDNDGYNFESGPTGIVISGDTYDGTFYGIQTLIQLLPFKQSATVQIPSVMVRDEPKFKYRGLHLDCARHFWPVDFIKKYIDWIALHKMNYFHWHLTDDQGWRIEIKKYPALTKKGAWRNGTIIGRYPGKGNDGNPYGGFYTQQQIKEIVRYATDRYVTVVPEIEMPGHASAAIASYPELSCFPDEPTIQYFPKQCAWSGDSTGKQVQQTWGVFDDVFCAGKENTFRFLEDVLDEVLNLFPSRYIHVGGDECPKTNWKRCPLCQKRMKEEGLNDEHALQSYFIQRIEKYLNNKGRALIGWDEILEGGLAPNATVMSWRGEQGGIEAARQNHDVIMTPGGWCYLDHSQSENEDSVTIGGYTPIEKVYSYNPVPDSLNAEQAKHILGAQGNVWTEYMGHVKKVEYMIFPRMAALSEVLWSQNRDWKNFEKRLLVQFKRYDFWKVNYSQAYYDLKATVLPTPDFIGLNWKIQARYSPPGCDYCYIKCVEEFVYDRDTSFTEKIPVYNLKNPTQIERYTVTHRVMKAGEKGIRPFTTFRNINDTVATFFVNHSSTLKAWQLWSLKHKTEISQQFHFNKATGKKILLNNPPSPNYPGNGAFTLVNGVQNEKGLARSTEFLGFLGTHCEAIIDLGKEETIGNVIVHTLKQEASWIWRPLYVEVLVSDDGQHFISKKESDDFIPTTGSNGIMKIELNSPVKTRFVKVVIANWGTIPSGNPGSGNKAWLFVDEIEVN
jgi:hexosaminidase